MINVANEPSIIRYLKNITKDEFLKKILYWAKFVLKLKYIKNNISIKDKIEKFNVFTYAFFFKNTPYIKHIIVKIDKAISGTRSKLIKLFSIC